MPTEVQEVVKKVVGTFPCFTDVHIFRKHGDIEDLIKSNPRLVVMPPEHDIAYSKRDERRAFAAAQEILDKRGNQPRSKANRLVFLFSDSKSVAFTEERVNTQNGHLPDAFSGAIPCSLMRRPSYGW